MSESGKKWYVVRAISGQENKIKSYIENEIARIGLSDLMGQILVPTEKVYQIRNGKKVLKERNFFPGYIMVELILTGEAVHTIKNVTGVIGFLSEAKGGDAQASLIGTGSEVNLCIQVQDLLAKEGVRTSVVSMPCWQLFEKQDQTYRDSVLPPKMRVRIAVEMASPLGWERWVGLDGAIVGMNSFGASAPLKHLLKKFGFEPEPVAAVVRATIAKNAAGAGR